MGADAWVTVAVLVGVLTALVRQRTSPWVVVLGGVIALLVLGVVTPAQAFPCASGWGETPLLICY